LPLSLFGFQALWSPYFFVALFLVLVAFFLITVKYRDRFNGSEPLTKTEGTLFVVSIVLLYIAKGSPIDLMGHLTFSAHMVQMGVVNLVIPPMLIVAVPKWLWLRIINLKGVRSLFRFFTKPFVAIILFNGIFSFYHIPFVFDIVKTDMWLHAGYNTLLFILAIFLWWPLLNKLDETPTLSGIKKVGYIFANGPLLTPACALIIFADAPLYATFSDPDAWTQSLALCVPSTTLSGLNLSGPEMFTSMPLLFDQQLGGILMKIIQELTFGVVLAKVFINWYRKEADEVDPEPEDYLPPHPIKQ
jgi:putative membrane protein